METILINTEFIMLNQLLKFANVAATGGEANDMILDGFIFVNGDMAFQKRKKIYPGDEILIKCFEDDLLLKIEKENI